MTVSHLPINLRRFNHAIHDLTHQPHDTHARIITAHRSSLISIIHHSIQLPIWTPYPTSIQSACSSLAVYHQHLLLSKSLPHMTVSGPSMFAHCASTISPPLAWPSQCPFLLKNDAPTLSSALPASRSLALSSTTPPMLL
jgi:hypothetical protein